MSAARHFFAAPSAFHFWSPASRSALDANPYSRTVTVSAVPPNQKLADMNSVTRSA
jgi:hypothetical protein